MPTRVFTVWTSSEPGHAPAFEIYPAPSAGAGADAIYLTNDPEAFEDLFPAGQSRVAPILTLYSFAFPLLPSERIGQLFAESGLPPDARSAQALWQVWLRIEARLKTFPLWAVETIQLILHELDEPALSRFFAHFARMARDGGAPDAPWYQTFPAMTASREKPRSLPDHQDCSALDVDAIAAYLMPDGTFSRLMPGYESRKGQVTMTRAVADAFNGRQHLLVEAGTGVGKSLAYLLPAVAWARLNDMPVIISTNTRNLQTQLIEKDLPRVFEAVKHETGEETPFRAVLLKGRINYFCLRRLSILLENRQFELDRPELRHFAEALAWVVQSGDGDLDTFAGATRCEPAFLAKIASTGEECPGRRCRFYRRCFLQKARTAAANAHLVIANHALVFSEAAAAGSTLPPYSHIVFDEAHNLEEAATRHLSTELSAGRINQAILRLAHGKGPHAGGLLEQVRKHLARGALTGDAKEAQAMLETVKRAKRQLERVRSAFTALFDTLPALFPPETGTIRFRCEAPTPGSITDIADLFDEKPLPTRTIAREGIFTPPPEGWDEREASQRKEDARGALLETVTILKTLADDLQQATKDELNLYGDLSLSVEGAIASLKELIGNLDFVWAGTDPDFVFWMEMPAHHAKLAKLVAAPLSIASQLKDLLYEQKDSVIFCSATLRVGSSFNYIANRLGINLLEDPARVMTCVAESPFDYLTQCAAIAPAFLPDPGISPAKNGEYVEQLSGLMLDVFKKTRGRALGLFTSYQMMNQVASLLEEPLREIGIRLLVQGTDGTRDQITRIFRSGDPAVLLGTHSFWEGVDVAGEALSCVVMARLPFSAVGDPVVEARCEQIEQAGGSPFREFSLPLAVIRFRQGFGRLIRTRSDRGVVIIADPRLMTKNYGMTFRKSLPCSVMRSDSRLDLLERIDKVFGENR
ncbi:MAG: hypothetical protein J6334_13525 [Kiritimatiellae bacterium]|nr:hypothetical protein [Kiritimatiellia bacterium]